MSATSMALLLLCAAGEPARHEPPNTTKDRHFAECVFSGE
jgi:hypothetical protein